MGLWGRQRPIWVRSGRTTANAGTVAPRLPKEGGGRMKRGCKKETQEKAKGKGSSIKKKLEMSLNVGSNYHLVNTAGLSVDTMLHTAPVAHLIVQLHSPSTC